MNDLLAGRLPRWQARVEQALEQRLPAESLAPQTLHRAMRYSVLGGGKRVRPVLVYAAAEAAGAPLERADAAACAVELIHAYSLIHDDLPAMDDDDLRRGRPSCHRAFDEATAILAGDALQTLAFDLLARDPALDVAPSQRLAMIQTLATAAGATGMVGGQAMDLAAVGQTLTLSQLETMHAHKTGALIRAAVRLGGLCHNGITPAELDKLERYACLIGLAFQVQDDILDVESDTATLGKRQGADQALNKPTFPALLGLEQAKQHARQLSAEAQSCLAPFGSRAETLRAIAAYIVTRRH
ncbi:MAG TPA: (2E,6E)-farnesyl diphosphate synthase [Gammaproteobacteria bacterium]|nr:(2E,6E)-farnesyl diphosphate synthase [Gammaproteobacteria bacterium]